MKINLSATGFWRIKGLEKEYPGDLYLNEDDGGIVLYIRIPNKGSIMSFLELPLEISFIVGTTINGAQITLVDCVRISTESRVGSEEVFGYQVKFMLDGATFNKEENISFTKMKVSIPGIIQWGDTSNYVMPDLDDKFTLIGLEVTEPIEIYACKEYSLFYYLTFSSPFQLMKEEINIKQVPYLIIEARTVQSLDWFIRIATQMKRLIEIAIGSPLGFDSMVVESPEIYYEFEGGKKFNQSLKVIHSFKQNITRENSSNRVLKHDYLFNLSELRQAKFSQWQEISTIMEPIIELYIDSIYNENLSVSRHFLNVVQALETYHSRRIAYSIDDFKARVTKLLEIRPEPFREQDNNFLLSGSYKFVTLRSRLTDLLLANFSFFFYTGDFKVTEFPQIIANTRNYYTHYNQKIEEKALKGADLINAYHILQNILEFYLLKEFGFEEKFIHERIRERIRPIVISNDIKKADKNKNYE
ncbi:TPA: hypothetical protein QCU60_001196 [Bacillus cereus]|nr:hypothetical protein [Bacillus cereus]